MLVIGTDLQYFVVKLRSAARTRLPVLAYFHAQDPPLTYGAQARHMALFFQLTRNRVSQEQHSVNRTYKTNIFRVNSVKIK
jgi:hypothetical protein